jgi:hypothetical protein
MPLPDRAGLDALKVQVAKDRPPPTRVAPGEYRCKIASVAEKKSQKGQKMLAVSLRLIDVPGRPTVFGYVMMEGLGAFMFDILLNALLYNPDLDGTDIECLVNRTCNVLLEDETRDAVTRSKWKKFLVGESDAHAAGPNGVSTGSVTRMGDGRVIPPGHVHPRQENDGIDLGVELSKAAEGTPADPVDAETAAEIAEAEAKLFEVRRKASPETANVIENLLKRLQDRKNAAAGLSS